MEKHPDVCFSIFFFPLFYICIVFVLRNTASFFLWGWLLSFAWNMPFSCNWCKFSSKLDTLHDLPSGSLMTNHIYEYYMLLSMKYISSLMIWYIFFKIVYAVPCTKHHGSRVPLFHSALFAISNNIRTTSARPKRKSNGGGSTIEVDELVRVLLRKVGDEKFPLVTTLNKYVRTVRTEHCFLLFEELGRQDKWLQCLEVSTFLWIYEKIAWSL